jgi:hypothetical protein
MFSRSVAQRPIERAARFLGRARGVNRILHILDRVINTLTGPLGRAFLHTPCEESDRSDHAKGEDESGHRSRLHRELLISSRVALCVFKTYARQKISQNLGIST